MIRIELKNKELENEIINFKAKQLNQGYYRTAFEIEKQFKSTFNNKGPNNDKKKEKYNVVRNQVINEMNNFNEEELIHELINNFKDLIDKKNKETQEDMINHFSYIKSYDFSKNNDFDHLESEVKKLENELKEKKEQLETNKILYLISEIQNDKDNVFLLEEKEEIIQNLKKRYNIKEEDLDITSIEILLKEENFDGVKDYINQLYQHQLNKINLMDVNELNTKILKCLNSMECNIKKLFNEEGEWNFITYEFNDKQIKQIILYSADEDENNKKVINTIETNKTTLIEFIQYVKENIFLDKKENMKISLQNLNFQTK